MRLSVCMCEWNEKKRRKVKQKRYTNPSITRISRFHQASLSLHLAEVWPEQAVQAVGEKKIKHNLHNQVFNHCLHYLSYYATHSLSLSRFTFFLDLGTICRLRILFSRCWIFEPVFFLITVPCTKQYTVFRFFGTLFFHSTCGWQSIALFRMLLWSIVVDFFMRMRVSDRDTESLSFNAFIYGFIVLHTWFLFCILFF